MKLLLSLYCIVLHLSLWCQSNLHTSSIIPEKEPFYLKSWNLAGEVKSITIRMHEPRNPATRFLALDDCRSTASPGEAFHARDDEFNFNRKGQLMKRTQSISSEKIISLYSYNFQGQITGIESGDKRILFLYDFEGRLGGTEQYRGARLEWKSTKTYVADKVITINEHMGTSERDSLVEIFDGQHHLIYSAYKSLTHELKEETFSYDEKGRLIIHNNNLGMHFEYVYDDKDRIVKTYVGKEKNMMSTTEFNDQTGICKITRFELVNGEYIERNYECRCTVIDGQNNPIKNEYIDCSNSDDGDLFMLKGFYEIEYGYFK
jgi:hypothetical protein